MEFFCFPTARKQVNLPLNRATYVALEHLLPLPELGTPVSDLLKAQTPLLETHRWEAGRWNTLFQAWQWAVEFWEWGSSLRGGLGSTSFCPPVSLPDVRKLAKGCPPPYNYLLWKCTPHLTPGGGPHVSLPPPGWAFACSPGSRALLWSSWAQVKPFLRRLWVCPSRLCLKDWLEKERKISVRPWLCGSKVSLFLSPIQLPVSLLLNNFFFNVLLPWIRRPSYWLFSKYNDVCVGGGRMGVQPA